MRTIFQTVYITLFIFTSIEVIANMQNGVQTPLYISVIYGITTFLSMGKVTYWFLKG